MHEAMARYQYVYGLKPVGPHRREADRILRALRTRCDSCDGEGLRWHDDSDWRRCPSCEGTGGFWSYSSDIVEAARSEILDRYPEAAAPRGPLRFLSGALVYDLREGVILDASARDVG